MAGIISRFRALSPSERQLIVEATFELALACISIALFRFRMIAAAAGRRSPSATGAADPGAVIQQVRWAVEACTRQVPWRAKCFERGLAAQRMLRRRNVSATLYYGVARNGGRELMAHVWIRSGSIDVIGCENEKDFAELARFPPDRG